MEIRRPHRKLNGNSKYEIFSQTGGATERHLTRLNSIENAGHDDDPSSCPCVLHSLKCLLWLLTAGEESNDGLFHAAIGRTLQQKSLSGHNIAKEARSCRENNQDLVPRAMFFRRPAHLTLVKLMGG